MKNCNEMVNSLLERRDQYLVEQKRKRKIIVRTTTTSICCLFLAAMLGFGLWQSGAFNDVIYPKHGEEDLSGEAKEYSVYTDSVRLPENGSGELMDMIGCLVYKGKVYTQSNSFFNYVPDNIEQLVGEYVGEAKGTLDEWSSQEDLATELASTYSGSVYKVNGYSEDFRLCIYEDSGDGQYLGFLDNYDGIGLNIGADLFEDRLHIMGNVKSVIYRTHENWNYEYTPRYQDLTAVTNEQFEDFLNMLCNSPFERIDYMDDPSFYDSKEVQGHLYLNMKDGTCVELRLLEGGYVSCNYLGRIFVKMPGEIFDSVLAACQ